MKSRNDLIKELQDLEATADEIRKRRRQVIESLAGVSTPATALPVKEIKQKYKVHTAKVRARRAANIKMKKSKRTQ